MHLWLMPKSTIFVVVDATIFCATMVKMTYNHKFDYKMIWSYNCNYGLQLIFISMKMNRLNMDFFFIHQEKNGENLRIMFRGLYCVASWTWLCAPMSTPITIAITTFTTHNIKIPLMVHHIQTKRLTHLQQCNIPSPKYKKPKHLYNKKKLQSKNYVL
jgi:hypothetical protein